MSAKSPLPAPAPFSGIDRDHPSHLVFKHLGRFFESRGLAPTARSAALLKTARDRLVTELNQIGYFRVDATAPGGGVTTLFLLGEGGKYATQGPQLRGLIASLGAEGPAKAGKLSEVILVAPPRLLGKKNMTQVVEEFRGGGTHYNVYPYPVFSLDIPRAQCVPRHEVVPPAEIAAILKRERLAPGNLKRMLASDPPVVWIGGRPGQVVRTVSPSETAGEAYDYWLLIP